MKNWLKKLYNKLFNKKEVKPAVNPTIQPVAPAEIKPIEAKPEDRSVVVGREGNRVTLAGPTAAFLGATGTEKPVDVTDVATDHSGFIITHSGNYRSNFHSKGKVYVYQVTLNSPGNLTFWYAATGGSNSGASVTSRVVRPDGLDTGEDTRILSNSQSFSILAPVAGAYNFHIEVSEDMSLQVGAYF